jgi:hypothetical protein
MLILLVLFGSLLTVFGIFILRKGGKLIGGTIAVAGGLLVLLAIVAFIVALVNFHP